MSHGFPEADWKVFRQLREVALQRFCERVLEEARAVSSDASKSAHRRYLDLYRIIQDRDSEIADAFNAPRRSQAILQLAMIHARGLLEPAELARFSTSTQETLARLVDDAER